MRIRHHYVPQFYLKKFSDPNQPDYVFAYTREKDPFKTHTQRIAVERHFYTVNLEATGERSDQFERMFSKIENEAAHLFDRLANDTIVSLTKDEQGLLSYFIAQLYNRGPAFRKKQNDWEITKKKKLIQFIAEEKNRFDQMTREAGLTFENEAEAEQTREMWLNFDKHFKATATGGEGSFMTTLLELTEELALLIFNKCWYILDSTQTDIFITSDSPVTLYIENWNQKIGKGFLNSSVVLPISPTRCMFLSNEMTNREIKLRSVSRQRVLQINKNTMVHAYQRIFSHKLHRGIQKAFDKTKVYQSDQTMDIRIRVKPT